VVNKRGRIFQRESQGFPGENVNLNKRREKNGSGTKKAFAKKKRKRILVGKKVRQKLKKIGSGHPRQKTENGCMKEKRTSPGLRFLTLCHN